MVAPDDVDTALAALPEAVVVGETTAWDGSGPRIIL